MSEAAIARLRELNAPGEPDVACEIGGIFLAEAPRKIALARDAIARADAPAVEGAAHSLKGSCRNLGAEPLARICGRLENAAREGAIGGAAALMAEIDAELGRVRRALGAKLGIAS